MRQLELMQNDKESQLGSESGHEPYATIDDLVERARELFSGLKKLSESKYPLDIRRGVGKGVRAMADKKERSRTVKAGSKTYFFDLKETREGKPYLVITESRFKGEGEERERQTIVVFQESAQKFSEAVSDMAGKLAE